MPTKVMVYLFIGLLFTTAPLFAKQPEKIINSIGMTFVYIPPGTFKINDTYKITLTHGFYIQTTEVTQGQWKSVMPHNPSHYKECGDNCPVESVSWNDTQRFIRKLNQFEGGVPKYRLPTTAEWSYACLAGGLGPYSFGDFKVVPIKPGSKYSKHDTSIIDGYAWYEENSEDTTHPVGQKKPNAWGLYDVHGNVDEWCQDFVWFRDKDKEKRKHFIDPAGPIRSIEKTYQGGSYCSFIESADAEHSEFPEFIKFVNQDGHGLRLVKNP